MTRSRIRRGASILLAGCLAALSTSVARAEALPPYGGPPPDMVRPDTPLPVLFLFYQSVQQAQAWAQAPQRVTCPRHTKPRVDCTPVSQR
jgi:hypothetical protein